MRPIPGLVVIGVGLVTACSGHAPTNGATTLPPGATVITRPTEPPQYPEHRIGFPFGKYVMAGPLPTSSPGTGRAYTLDTPVQRRALALARSLGFGDTAIGFGLFTRQGADEPVAYLA